MTAAPLGGKVALVTGAARGIGAAIAERLTRDGASVVRSDVVDLDTTDEDASVRYVRLDVAEETEWAAVTEGVVRLFGRVDILVNNAGIDAYARFRAGAGSAAVGDYLADVESEVVSEFERMVAVNQRGVWLGMRAVAPHMRHSGGGSIVNMSSIFGSVGGFGGSIAYHATKGAVRTMTKNAAVRFAADGIRVNSVHPGFIDTRLLDPLRGTAAEKRALAATPLGRFGHPAEVASAVAYLAGDDASYITGAELYVDGGWTAV